MKNLKLVSSRKENPNKLPLLRVMKINKWDLIKQAFYTTKEIINKIKRQSSEWEKTVANEQTDKKLVSKNIQTAHTTQYQRNKQPSKKKGRSSNRHFSKEDTQ